MKAVIYVRVSDLRQSDGTSLESQEDACRGWCRRNSVVVAKVFVEAGASAKTANRPQFQAMFAWLSENASNIDFLVIDKWDRFSRNIEDGIEFRAQLRAWRIELVAASQATTDDPAGRFMRNVLQSVAQFDNEQRAERSLNGMRRQVEAGRFVNPAPLGYENNGKHSPSLLIDNETAPLVRGMYERVIEGQPVTDALKWARLHGLRGRRGAEMAVQTASRLLRNPAYAGRLEIPSWGISRQGDWEPIVEPGLWAKAQVALDRKSAPLQVVHTTVNDKYILRGVIVCDSCGRLATASTSKSKSGKGHPYYHCVRGRGHLRISVAKADAMFAEYLERLVPNEPRLRVVEAAFREVWSSKNASAGEDRERLKAQLNTLQMRKNRLLGLVQDGAIERADFDKQYRSLGEQITATEAAIANTEPSGEHLDVETAWGYLEHLLYNQHVLWLQADAAEKRRIARLIFPSGCRFSKEGIGTPFTTSIFNILGDVTVPQEELVALTTTDFKGQIIHSKYTVICT